MTFLRPVPLTIRPTVSVVIPCYNYGHFLPDAVQSVLGQQDVDADVIIVDDASPDGSVEVAHGLAAADSRVRVVAHSVNRGHIATYNEGLALASAEFVVLLSADDLLVPGSLGRAAALFASRPDLAFVYGYAQDFQGAPPSGRQCATSWSVWQGERWIDRLCRRGGNVITSPEVVMRTEVMHASGGYDPSQPHTADMHLWLRAALMGNVGRVNGADQAFYREHGSNMHLTDFAGLMTDIRERRVVFRALADVDAANDPRADRWREWSSRTLAREAIRLGCATYDSGAAGGGASIDDFARFACETWPDIKQTALWHQYLRRSDGSLPRWRRAAFSVDLDVRNRVRWRRARRYGT